MPHALHIFSTFAAAGPELRAVELMAGLGDGYRHTIVAMDDCLDAAKRIGSGVQARTLAGPGVKKTNKVIRWTWELLDAEQPDLLLTYNWGAFDAVLAARMKRFPHHVHHEDGFNLDEANQELGRRRFLRRMCLPRVQHLIVPSSRLESLARSSWKVPEDKLSLLPNGVDVKRFCPQPVEVRDEVRGELGIPLDAHVIGTVAGYRPVKRLDRLIRAAANLAPGDQETHLVLIGDGSERLALEALAKEHMPPGGRVHFLGFRDDLPRLYAALDVFALTSASEQQPISLLEAMASGLPAVCTNVGDIHATLGPLCNESVCDPDADDLEAQLTAAFQRLLENPSLGKSLGAEARKRVKESYSSDAMIAGYRAVYESCGR